MNQSNERRPWDKAFSRLPKSFTSHGITNENAPSDVNSCASFVLIDGTPFYSDRFYLNAPTGCTPSTQETTHHDQNLCECQVPPPLFDRSRLIRSLDLVAVIASTYVIDAEWLHHELPMLFPPPLLDGDGIQTEISPASANGFIPTLVLHGHRGLRRKNKPASTKSQRLRGHYSHRSKKDVYCDSVLKTKNSKVDDTRTTFKKEQDIADTVNSSINPRLNVESRHDKHGLSHNPKHKGYDKNTNSTESFDHNATNTTIVRCPVDANDALKKVVVIEIKDESDAESNSSSDEIQVIKCIPASQNDSRADKTERSRSHNHCKTPRLNVVSLAAKHRKSLYQSPVYENTMTDVDTDQESEFENEIVHSPITPLSFSNASLDDVPPEEGWRHRVHIDDEKKEIIEDDETCNIFGKSVYLTEILPRWIPSKDNQSFKRKTKGVEQKGPRTTCNGVIDLVDDFSLEADDVGVDPETVARRKPCVGVHHPKYMLLFERRGSVVVIVSTSNLTSPSAVDGSWVQRFEPRYNENTNCRTSSRRSESDFGYVLCDFLQRQSDAAKEHQILPIQFLRKYLCEKITSLDDLRLRYRFDQASAHLVSTVPGCFRRLVHPLNNRRYKKGPQRKKISSRTFKRVVYGPQRVAEITCSINEQNRALSLPKKTTTSVDRLIFQTTSFGGNWKSGDFEDLARMYLGLDNNNSSCIHDRKNLLDRVKVVWPSQDFIKGIVNARKQTSRNDLEAESCPDLSPENFTFLSTKAFNSIDLECVSCMAQYETCNPSPMSPWVLSPHIKTIARVLQESTQHDENFDEESVHGAYFAWVMLTSACLSHGAQGIKIKEKCFKTELTMHTNFELGILFCSSHGNDETDKVYSSYPTNCFCRKQMKKNQPKIHPRNLIPLPIPYKIHPQPYQLDPDEADFNVTPCFHEITPGTEVTGQMMLTPLGKRFLMEQYSKSAT